MTKTAPGPSPSPTRDLAAVGLDDPLGDGHAQAGPLGLGGEERVEDLLPLLGLEARAVVADGDADRRLAVELGRLGADLDRDRGRAGGQGVLEDVAEDLPEPERVRRRSAGRRHRSSRARVGLLRLAGRLEVRPGLAPDLAQVAGAPVELDRGGVAADVLVEVVEVVLGLLEPVDQVERLGPVADGQGEHLQAGLAALQGVAALVGQPGDHLADGGQPLGLQGPLLGLLERT